MRCSKRQTPLRLHRESTPAKQRRIHSLPIRHSRSTILPQTNANIVAAPLDPFRRTALPCSVPTPARSFLLIHKHDRSSYPLTPHHRHQARFHSHSARFGLLPLPLRSRSSSYRCSLAQRQDGRRHHRCCHGHASRRQRPSGRSHPSLHRLAPLSSSARSGFHVILDTGAFHSHLRLRLCSCIAASNFAAAHSGCSSQHALRRFAFLASGLARIRARQSNVTCRRASCPAGAQPPPPPASPPPSLCLV